MLPVCHYDLSLPTVTEMMRKQSNICKYLEEKCWSHFFMSHLSCYNQSWVFTGRTDVEAKTPIFWPLDEKSWLIWKEPWCWERLRAEGEGDDRGWDGWMASPNQWTWVWGTPGVGDGQGGLACCSSWGHKLSDTAERLNWTEIVFICAFILHCLPSFSSQYTHPYTQTF